MSAADPHDTPPGLLAGLGPAVLGAIKPFDDEDTVGVIDAAKPAVIAALSARHEQPVLILTPTPASAADLLDALPLWLGRKDRDRLLSFPARETRALRTTTTGARPGRGSPQRGRSATTPFANHRRRH